MSFRPFLPPKVPAIVGRPPLYPPCSLCSSQHGPSRTCSQDAAERRYRERKAIAKARGMSLADVRTEQAARRTRMADAALASRLGVSVDDLAAMRQAAEQALASARAECLRLGLAA